MPKYRTPLTTEQRLRVSKKIQKMKREEKKKPKGDRMTDDQIFGKAYGMVRGGRD